MYYGIRGADESDPTLSPREGLEDICEDDTRKTDYTH